MTTTPKRMRGFSLVEMMIALLLGTFLMMGLVQVFAASRSAYATSEGMARIQESGRFALDVLQRDLRMAGHFGCVGDQARLMNGPNQFTLAYAAAPGDEAAFNTRAWPMRFHISLQGYEYTGTGGGAAFTLPATPAVAGAGNRALWSPAAPGTLAARSVRFSDIVVVRYLRPEAVTVTAIGGPGGATTPDLTFDGTRWDVLASGVDNPGLFAMTDCMSVTVFGGGRLASGNQVRTTSGGLGFRETYEPGRATLHRAETVAYYVGIGASGEPALFRCRLTTALTGGNLTHGDAADNAADCSGAPEELVEGVESLQLVYGESMQANGRPTGYIRDVRTAAALAEPALSTAAGATSRAAWRRVGAVQIGLIVRSPQAVPGSDSRTAPFSVLGNTITPPADRRTRAVYESTVALRNRLFGN